MQEQTDVIHKQLVGYGIEIGLLISGFFGALLLVSKNASQRMGATVASLLAGTACANYLTPVVLNFLPESIRAQGKYAAAFMMGFMGLKGLELMIDKFVKKEEEGGKKNRSRSSTKRKGKS
jgi:hypothetical protein